ncbi:serine dehydratase [bacterium]|nr:serine dehydratase [bacterium]
MVDFSYIEAAHDRISSFVHRTPVRASRRWNEEFGAELFFKCENFQVTGSFKYRGATNAILQLTESERERGVLTFSSGNHAQALARAGEVHGVAVTVVMPDDAPALKIAATKGYGGEVILYDRDETTRESLGAKLAEERGLTVIPPYDHPWIVAGQGTAVKELIEDVGELDQLYVCAGGGGLLSGSSISARELSPNCAVIGVEPEAGDDICRSFRSGTLESVKDPVTIADGARTPSASALTFSIIRENVSEMLSVPDDWLIKGTKRYAETLKMIVEPTGCLSFAPILGGTRDIQGQRVGIVVTGGNVDLARLAEFWSHG